MNEEKIAEVVKDLSKFIGTSTAEKMSDDLMKARDAFFELAEKEGISEEGTELLAKLAQHQFALGFEACASYFKYKGIIKDEPITL